MPDVHREVLTLDFRRKNSPGRGFGCVAGSGGSFAAFGPPASVPKFAFIFTRDRGFSLPFPGISFSGSTLRVQPPGLRRRLVPLGAPGGRWHWHCFS